VVRYTYEELTPGHGFQMPGATITEDAIIRFAMEWDYQPFHVDREKAKASLFGGLIASGIHTFAMAMRLCNEGGLFREPAVAGLGIDNLRWLEPLRPGSTITPYVTVRSCRVSQTKPGLGIVTWDIVVSDHEERTVLSFSVTNLVRRSDSVDAEPESPPVDRA